MAWLEILRWLHVLGACVLIGTGSGIAFFMVMAHRTGRVELIAHTAQIVVVADFLFTASAVVVQPLTGVGLAIVLGWPLSEGWIVLSVALYVFIGLFWVPVVFIQIRLRDEALRLSAAGQELSARYHRLYRIWFACGIPAFAAIMVLVWLMVARPTLSL
ncbi:MAG: DUF2269 domain-containing protein [Tateyamaria sp.]|uniref:DUF2269 family protein n=1 Tax=Roseobacteraceae TaxID=2854170 RepID=UPI0032968125